MNFDPKTKELVAVGSSIAANCQPCLEYHLKMAKSSGATEDEIKDAMEIARAVKNKSAMVMEKFAEEILCSDHKSSLESCQEKKRDSSKVCCG